MGDRTLASSSQLQLDNIVLTRAGQKVLDIPYLIFDPVPLTVLVGPNGAGKSSLLQLLSGELTATSGALSLWNTPLTNWQSLERARRLAVLPQRSQLNFAFTVREVVALGCLPHDAGSEADRVMVDACLAELDLTHLEHEPYTQLSGGEQQRVQLARVFCQLWPLRDRDETGLLLLDEPLTALDIAHQHALMRSLHALGRFGIYSIVVLHDLSLAAQYAQRILVLNQGHIVADGTPETALSTDVVNDVFAVQSQIVSVGGHQHFLVEPLCKP